MDLTIGKIRGLQRISGSEGIFTICAMDHRGSLESKMCAGLTPEVCLEDMTSFKLELCRALAAGASAVLLDPIYGAAQAMAGGVVPRTSGLLVSLESSGYTGSSQARETELLPAWSVAKIKRMGADAVKLLVYYRPDLEELASRQRALVQLVAQACRRYDIPCLVEATSYAVGAEVGNPGLFARRKPELVITTARQLTVLPIDVLKAEFPADLNLIHSDSELLEICRELDAASAKPWVILSAGADYATFERQVGLACRAGASGFLAGRAIWQEAVEMDDEEERRCFLETTALGRLKKLSSLARRHGTPWQCKKGLQNGHAGAISGDWYRNYAEAQL
jgi:tagatose 1,6-diphosphate aldolase